MPFDPSSHSRNQEALTDIPLRSFGSVKEWECKTNEDLLTLFNKQIPLPDQVSWTCFQFDTRVSMRMISALQMKGIMLAKWQQLPKIRGQTRQNTSNLWGWTLSYRGCSTRQKCVSSQGLQHGSGTDSTKGESASRLEQSLALSQPLDRRSRWPVETTLPK